MQPGRLIVDGPQDGPTNMAADEVLLRSAKDQCTPSLRFYTWKSPTLSLGYFQEYADRDRHPDSRRLAVVRRRSGGGAIVHDCELTYSLAWPAELASRHPRQLYVTTHTAIIRAFAKQGLHAARRGGPAQLAAASVEPFLCFLRNSPDDIVLQGVKIVGSAQRRAGRATLLHGSILLARSRWAPEVLGIEQIAGTPLEVDSFRQGLIQELGEIWGIRWETGGLSAREDRLLWELARDRFGSADWTTRR